MSLKLNREQTLIRVYVGWCDEGTMVEEATILVMRDKQKNIKIKVLNIEIKSDNAYSEYKDYSDWIT